MFTIIATIFVGLLIAVGIFFVIDFKHKHKIKQIEKTAATQPEIRRHKVSLADPSDTKWRAVKIKAGLICCEGAQKVTNQIYLAVDAPVFPLNDCTIKACQCKYLHLSDRRDGDDRRETTEYLEDLLKFHEKERRTIMERRLAV